MELKLSNVLNNLDEFFKRQNTLGIITVKKDIKYRDVYINKFLMTQIFKNFYIDIIQQQAYTNNFKKIFDYTDEELLSLRDAFKALDRTTSNDVVLSLYEKNLVIFKNSRLPLSKEAQKFLDKLIIYESENKISRAFYISEDLTKFDFFQELLNKKKIFLDSVSNCIRTIERHIEYNDDTEYITEPKSYGEVVGMFFGYPKCCVETWSPNGNMIPWKLRSNEIQKASVNGFVPCQKHAEQINNKKIDIISIINKKRICSIPFTLNQNMLDDKKIDMELSKFLKKYKY